ncbi:MAG: methyltransferase domain-containing protein [Anaerolineae bacterium]|nr:methyltransferase domain-containing protein [Anaerolineae bacterium]
MKQSPSFQERPICDYEGSTYRTDFWGSQDREYEDQVERLAIRALLPQRGERLLDVGAGFGRLASLYHGYKKVILLDYSRSQLAYARQQLGDEGFIYVAADLYTLPLATNAVDTTVMVRVLHHIADVPAALQQIWRVTRPEGTFLLEFANKRHLKNILRYLLGRGVNPFSPEPYEFAKLHFDFHPRWVLEQLLQAGFALQERRSVSLFRAALLKRIFPTPWLVKIDGLLQRPTAPLALGPSVFVRSRVLKKGQPKVAAEEVLFRCPSCGHEPLQSERSGLYCSQCGASWPLEEGIYVFK